MPREAQGATVAPKVPDTSGHLSLVEVPDGAQGLKGKVLLDCGLLTAPGLYVCRINTTGMNVIFVNMRPLNGSVAELFAPSIRTVWVAGGARTTSAGSNFVDNTNQQLTLADLQGQRTVEVYFTIPADGEIEFDRAEFNGL